MQGIALLSGNSSGRIQANERAPTVCQFVTRPQRAHMSQSPAEVWNGKTNVPALAHKEFGNGKI
ncbi:MAG: hypothetical protein RLZ98_766 [Pseudomonadota bacterium]|jgi:hypothetical protein